MNIVRLCIRMYRESHIHRIPYDDSCNCCLGRTDHTRNTVCSLSYTWCLNMHGTRTFGSPRTGICGCLKDSRIPRNAFVCPSRTRAMDRTYTLGSDHTLPVCNSHSRHTFRTGFRAQCTRLEYRTPYTHNTEANYFHNWIGGKFGFRTCGPIRNRIGSYPNRSLAPRTAFVGWQRHTDSKVPMYIGS